ncbi:MAG: phage baseplate assembly protein V [Deltaproteobacteria bacterium]|nr:phage baseplate assembly protein V [Deltaproteobacteria bacterium]
MTLERLQRAFQELVADRFYGKYEAVVTDTEDPLEIGRLRARVPAVLGEDAESGWALPCAPFGGGKDRGLLLLPEPGDTVWIEFAAGDVSRPIWSGAFWGAPESAGGQDDLADETGTEVPTSEGQPAGPGHFVLRTRAGHRLTFDDQGDVVLLAHGSDKVVIRLTAAGEVEVTADKIKLGKSAAEPLVLGQTFMQLFNSHTHPTGVGPSGPPTPPMTSGQLSTKSFTE